MTFSFAQRLRIRNAYVREALAECLGTFILVTIGCASVAQSVFSKEKAGTFLSVNFGWGLAVMFGVYVSGGISGGHINPAVTLAMATIGKFPFRKVPLYMIAQYIGAFLGSVVVFYVYRNALTEFEGEAFSITSAGIWATYPQSFLSTGNGFGDQVLGTALLVACALAITDARNMGTPKGVVPLMIGLVVAVIGMTYGFNCGYAINPARDLSPRIFTAIAGWGSQVFRYKLLIF
jgi:aquaporin-9